MCEQDELLLLVHRIPYPPNKGDKIRSFNLLKHLSKSYRVHLGAFVDDSEDWQYQDNLTEYCGEVHLEGLNPGKRKVASLRGLLNGASLTVPYYAHPGMQQWVTNILQRRPIKCVVVFSSPMAQYVAGDDYSALRRVADFVDIDSDKWAQYACSKRWPMSWLYRREARTLLTYERKIAAEFDASVFVSEYESDMFKTLAPSSASRCCAIHNGVDTDYFSPDRHYQNPYENKGKVLVFTGAMDYWANVDAVSWFVEQIFPAVRQALPDTQFYIVGARPTPAVQALEKVSGVTVTGSVKDIRPYLAYADLSVVPMRIARGVQNKILEAMSMAVAVLASPEAAEGLTAEPGKVFAVEEGAEDFIRRSIVMLQNPSALMAQSGRVCVLENYSWARNLSRFDQLLAEHPVELTHNNVDHVSQA